MTITGSCLACPDHKIPNIDKKQCIDAICDSHEIVEKDGTC